MAEETIRVRPNDGADDSESLFESLHWFYAFCREHLFRDDTDRIVDGLWPTTAPPPGASLLEIGCGPGFYSRQLAARFTNLRVTGIDRAEEQLGRARRRAEDRRLGNVSFEKADVRSLAWPNAAFTAVVASRLFTILPEREQALAEMFRVLQDDGRCFIAEPRSMLRAAIPLHAMWLLARLIGFCRERPGSYREPSRIAIMSDGEFAELIASQPWSRAHCWHDAWYQYAICEKGFSAP